MKHICKLWMNPCFQSAVTLMDGNNCNQTLLVKAEKCVQYISFESCSLYRISSPLWYWRVSLNNLLTSVPSTSFLLDKGLNFDLAIPYKELYFLLFGLLYKNQGLVFLLYWVSVQRQIQWHFLLKFIGIIFSWWKYVWFCYGLVFFLFMIMSPPIWVLHTTFSYCLFYFRNIVFSIDVDGECHEHKWCGHVEAQLSPDSEKTNQ